MSCKRADWRWNPWLSTTTHFWSRLLTMNKLLQGKGGLIISFYPRNDYRLVLLFFPKKSESWWSDHTHGDEKTSIGFHNGATAKSASCYGAELKGDKSIIRHSSGESSRICRAWYPSHSIYSGKTMLIDKNLSANLSFRFAQLDGRTTSYQVGFILLGYCRITDSKIYLGSTIRLDFTAETEDWSEGRDTSSATVPNIRGQNTQR